MSTSFTPPLRPRQGSILRVLTIERISTEHQDERSLDDQRANSKARVESSFDASIEWKHIASRGSGEVTDRDSYREMEDIILSGWPDLVIAEDLARICRRLDALRICELCEDFGTRLIALNDHVDTYKPDWKMSAMFSTLHHERHNQDTSDRIKRSLRHRFEQGALLAAPPYGYRYPSGAKHDSQVSTDPAAQSVYDRWFELLEGGASYSEVADWLNSEGVPTGPQCGGDRWTTAMVTRITHNPILKGERHWNERTTKRENRSGRRKSAKAPKQLLLIRRCPHLAFIEPERYDRLLRRLDKQNEIYRRGKAKAKDARQGVPRSRTIWPGQSMYCGVCGRVLYYGAHGQVRHLLCSGAINYNCWNAASVNGLDASRRICEAVKDVIQKLPDFDSVLIDEVRSQVNELTRKNETRIGELQRDLMKIDNKKSNIVDFISTGNTSPTIAQALSRLEQQEVEIADELADLEAALVQPFELPSAKVIRQRGLDLFASMAPETPEFGRLMNQFIEDLIVHPVQPIDDGKVSLRATFTVNLEVLISGEPHGLNYGVDQLKEERQVDLFDPPQRIWYLRDVVRLSGLDELRQSRSLKEREIAEQLGITQTAVQRAKKLYRLMRKRGVDDPYQVLSSPPTTGKFRRHLHKRYKFRPLRP